MNSFCNQFSKGVEPIRVQAESNYLFSPTVLQTCSVSSFQLPGLHFHPLKYQVGVIVLCLCSDNK